MTEHASLDQLAQATGGNPKAIEIALGLVKRGRPLNEVLDWVHHDRSLVLDDLFERAWVSLSSSARSVLVAMLHLRPTTDDEPLLAVSGLSGSRVLVEAVGELVDLSLLDILQDDINQSPRYELHPLVSSFIDARICGDLRCSVACVKAEEGCSFEQMVGETRERWLAYAVALAARVGFCPGDVDRLKLLDTPGRRQLIESAASWALDNGRYAEAVQIGRESRYFFYVRGLWHDTGSIHLLRAEAAHALGDFVEEFDARTYFVNIAAKQGDVRAFERELQRLEELVPSVAVRGHSLSEFNHAKALCQLAQGRAPEAIKIWRENIGLVKGGDEVQYNANLRWMAVALARDGRPGEAMVLLSEASAHADRHSFARAKVGVALEQAGLLLDMEAADEAGTYLEEIEANIESFADRNYRAEFAFLKARRIARTDVEVAREFAREAADEYQRLDHVQGHAKAIRLLQSMNEP
jgi:tetratricopeptide (TPR) repeat protein